MAKLTKQNYVTAKGETKLNCYHVNIPKSVVEKARIDEDEELAIYEFYGTIVIEKKYHCTCMECGFEWDTGIAYNECSACPRCRVGDIHYDINGGHMYVNSKQRIEEDT